MLKNIEKFDTEKSEVSEPAFDHEAEKEKRKQIRKMLVRMITESLKPAGFKKQGYSLWTRKVGEQWHVVYLQRSQFAHAYYFEVGICREQDLKKGEKPDIALCSKRERIEHIVKHAHREGSPGEVDKQKEHEIMYGLQQALHFEIPDVRSKCPDEYFVPSVSLEKAQQKIDTVGKIVAWYIPMWFDKYFNAEAEA